MTELTFGDASMDVVTSWLAIHTIADHTIADQAVRITVLDEALRCSRPASFCASAISVTQGLRASI
jgi:hypothetical protein